MTWAIGKGVLPALIGQLQAVLSSGLQGSRKA